MVHPIAEANEKSPLGELKPFEFYARHSVSHSSEYITNSRGVRIFTQWWAPTSEGPTTIVGSVCLVHGFACESSTSLMLTAVYLAKAGFVVCALDHEGHGESDGLKAHMPDVNPVVDDCVAFFDSFRAKHAPSPLPSFLYAIALLITLGRHPQPAFDGMVLSGAMCGISNKFKPPWPLEHLLGVVATLLPTWRVVPTRGSMADVSYKVEWKRRMEMASPNAYKGRPRAATAYELMRICDELQGRFEEVNIPLLIVHGGDDVICDPAYVEEMYRRASSEDKTLKIYPGMWHMLVGEPDENVELVFGDILDWLNSRALRLNPNTNGA